jgi:DNA-binding NarL/FixJ family response regulator
MYANDSKPTALSPREREVFGLLLQGMSNQEIAARLGVCRKTIEKHLTNIYTKIGVTSRARAIVRGTETK